jgi:predicted Ser/Thr protein kinase/TolB-like protein
MSVSPGQILSHYRLVEKIGEGGMGVVWRAEDTVLNRAVAIKVISADAAFDDGRRRMFLEEARLLSSVNDAHIVQIYELGREGSLDFIVMEHVEGKPLNRILHGRPLPPDRVADFGEQVARALSRVHRKGLLHRDLKPGNILVTPEGDVKVVDFGLATLFERHEASATEASTQPRGTDNSRTPSTRKESGLVGTPPYMSPEQVQGEKLDSRSDIFSFGVVLYEMTTGKRPFSGRTSAELLLEIVQGRFKAVHELVPKVPLDLDRIIQKVLAPRRADRYQTMEDLAVDLKRLRKDLESGSSLSYVDLKEALAPEKSRRSRLVGVAAVVMMCVAGAVGWLIGGPWDSGGADPHTVLILPMEVRGQSEGADYVGRAFAEAVAFTLAQAKDLTVLPVPAGGLKREFGALEPAKMALDAGAGRLLAGALAREGGAINVSLSLTDATKNRILWGARRRAEDGDIYALVSSLATLVAKEMATALPETLTQEFNLEVTLFRQRAEGGERLQPGERVRPGDRLFMEIQSPEKMYLYVINEDEKGQSYLLFPLSGLDLGNPLPAGTLHRLPGTRGGQPISWSVMSAGGRETFLVIASREPLRNLQNIVTAPPLEALKYLSLDRFIQSGVPERASGIWIRRIMLENP